MAQAGRRDKNVFGRVCRVCAFRLQLKSTCLDRLIIGFSYRPIDYSSGEAHTHPAPPTFFFSGNATLTLNAKKRVKQMQMRNDESQIMLVTNHSLRKLRALCSE